ncbi:hypothetical protein MKW94_012084 [Papaver nudicaule]|uniref:Late embryogenesis abundant protein LEA-2 subgroup domain-containing protein n=1 Tax=Papaver nudicaule TaxID=74823 RepID=A0AA41W3H4_PAPNU|nr:hypothetical protein [Papaver nudicaule]
MDIEKSPDPILQQNQKQHQQKKRRSCCCIASLTILAFLLTLIIIILILAFTVFKPKDPKAELVSAKIEGIEPKVSFPALKIELNITVEIELLIRNPNHASFRHGLGKSLVFYKDIQVGDVDVYPGTIPSQGSETVDSKLTLEADKFGSELTGLIRDVMAGEITIQTKTTIPGRVNFLGIIKKHAVATSDCQITIGISDMKVRQQQCRNKTKL